MQKLKKKGKIELLRAGKEIQRNTDKDVDCLILTNIYPGSDKHWIIISQLSTPNLDFIFKT